MTAITASAPGKVILFGEHSVNRGQPALATAVDRRVYCRATARGDDRYTFRSDDRWGECDRADLLRFKAEIDRLRVAGALDEIRAHAQGDFFAPSRYVLAHLVERSEAPGLDLEWRSDLPSSSGLGSGAAASAAMAMAGAAATGQETSAREVAFLAWQGDVIAHGGVASGLDSGACALGGVTRYSLERGPEPLPSVALPLVIGDTGIRANTAEVNTRVRTWLTDRPVRKHLFADMGWLVQHALAAFGGPSGPADLSLLGRLMNMNQLLLEKIGVSCPEIERLIEAALGAAALGAKLSGSGGGGIIIALTEPEQQESVAAAIDAAGGRSLIAATGAPGVRILPHQEDG